jgi:uncharacterized damage-inducible protein DinB
MYKKIEFPEQSEYPSYANMYMEYTVKDGSLIKQLKQSLETTLELIKPLSEEQLNFRYQEDKWSAKDILVHIIDDERIYCYRALAFARNDKTNFPGFEQDDYAKFSDTKERSTENILAEYEAVRIATTTLFEGFSKIALKRIGTANGNNTSVRALGYHILGHELHHIEVLKKRYLNL